MKKEIWKDIKGYENKYQISNFGSLKSLERLVKNKNGFRTVSEKILIASTRKDGYSYITFKNPFNNFSIHQLVAIAFLNHERCGFEIVVDHKNNNKLDNRVENLQLVTNRVNSTKDNKNKTGFIGVTKQYNKFKATIRNNGVSTYLGMFKTAELAYEGYLQARKKIESSDIY